MSKINKTDIVNIVAEKAYLSKIDAQNAVDLVFDTLEKALISKQEVSITNFGSFETITKKERLGTDPKTHAHITIPEKCTVSFKPSGILKEKLKNE